MDAQSLHEITDRLARSDLDPHAAGLVSAACRGDQALAAALGEGPATEPDPSPAVAPTPGQVLLGKVVVEGFRGIGEPAVLQIPPGAGLNLVIGRNGSGKSSFSDGIEAALTGTCARWAADASRDRRGGWANLHHPGPARVVLDLQVAGVGPVRWRRTWPDTDGDTPTLGALDCPDLTPDQIQAWSQALVTHRPFLATGELARLPDQRPTSLFDTLSRLLGLQGVTEAIARLGAARLERERAWRTARRALPPLRRRLARLDDPRAHRCKRALLGDSWDLDTVEAVLAGERAGDADIVVTNDVPTVATVQRAVTALRRGIGELAGLAGTAADRAQRLATLLELVLGLPADDPTCPVCQTPAALGPEWRATAASRIAAARASAAAAESADTALATAVTEARRLVRPAPAWLSAPPGELPDHLVADLTTAWAEWTALPHDPAALADHLETRHGALVAASLALGAAVDQARAALDASWRPVARDLAAWVARARPARAGHDARRALTRAEEWLKQVAAALRAERFAPIAERSQAVWSALRQESHVELGALRLAGAANANNRRVDLTATVDGVDAPALGVMSQGELNGLALSLFVPRATDSGSPFRFVVIDDPVQAMDPHKVDGLATVLGDVAATHQVVVFTHDARLVEAVRRMALAVPVHVFEVQRSPGSAVQVRPVARPADQYLHDARALLQARDKLGLAITVRLVAGACRHAIEAALTEEIRRVQLGNGVAHAVVEQQLRDTQGLDPLAALALLGDRRAGRKVGREIEARWGSAYAELLRDLNAGAHGALEAQDDTATALVRLTGRLVDRIGAVPTGG